MEWWSTPRNRWGVNIQLRALVNFCMRRLSSFESTEDEFNLRALGFSGRPNKSCDTCYAFWVGGALSLLSSPEGDDYYNCLDHNAWTRFAACCQDDQAGIGKNVESGSDPMHTTLSLVALSNVLGIKKEEVMPTSAEIPAPDRSSASVSALPQVVDGEFHKIDFLTGLLA